MVRAVVESLGLVAEEQVRPVLLEHLLLLGQVVQLVVLVQAPAVMVVDMVQQAQRVGL